MYGLQDLKPRIMVTPTTVECPVKGCCQSVARQRSSFKREERFRCPDHKIYISPSTFDYDSEFDNLLWTTEDDLSLLQAIKTVKRESRISRDNSEDAVTWNVFHYLESANQLDRFLSSITRKGPRQAELIYWSYSQKMNGAWSELNKARKEFGENIQHSSEPDLIAITERELCFIEAKLTATNNTVPSSSSSNNKYLIGGKKWFEQVFTSDFDTIAMKAKLFELFRFWLLGSWLASQTGRDFYLINITLSQHEMDVEHRFRPYIQAGVNRFFVRITWEDVYKYILDKAPVNNDKNVILDYFRNKTIGYHYSELQKAFMIDV